MNTEPSVDNALAARAVARSCHKSALSTLDKTGAPYVSLVTLAFDHDLSPIIIVSAMSAHTRNMGGDRRVAMLFDGTDGHPNPQTGPRLSLQGDAVKVDDPAELVRLRARWKIVPSRAQFVGGFGRAVWLTAPFGLDPAVIHGFQNGEAGLMAALAERGRTDVVSVDPDGYDVKEGEAWRRIEFPHTAAGLDQAAELIGG